MATSNLSQSVDRPPQFAPGGIDSPTIQRRLPDLRTILVPLALSESARAGLALGWNLARESGARLVLLHVAQLNIAGEERGIERTRLVTELCREAELQLSRLARRLGDDVATETIVCEGNPGKIIVEVAESLAVDAIILRAPKRRWLNWLRPSIAQRIARCAPCPVWLVSSAVEASPLNVTIVDRALARQSPKRESPHDAPRALRRFLSSLFGPASARARF